MEILCDISRYQEKMPLKCFQEQNKQKFSDSLNSQRWRFLKSGLDDFRSGFPPPSDNMIICGTKGPVPIVLCHNASNASRMAQKKRRKKCTKTQVSPSKLSPLQKASRDHIAQIEYCLSQHPLALYPHLEESVPPELFEEVVGILDPELCLNSEGGCEDCERDSHTPQKLQYQPEDGKSKETCPRPSALSKESTGKNLQYMCLSKKEVAAREKEMSLSYIPPLDENVRRVTKAFCDWVASLGGEKYHVDEDTILSLFDTGYETKPVFSVPIHVVELNNVPAELRKYVGVSPPQTAVKRPLRTRCHPSLAKVTMSDISLLRVTHEEREDLLHAAGYRPVPYAAMLCSAMIPAHLIAAWRGKVSYRGGRNKTALPRNLVQRITDYLHESFLEISTDDSRSIPLQINNLFWE